MAELTAEELKAMGFEVPGEATDPATLTPEQLAAMGFEVPAESVAPPPPPEVGAGETFALRGAGAVPAGGLVTDLVSAAILQLAKQGGLGEPGAVLPPQAQAELYRLGASEAEVRDPGNPIPGPVDVYRRLRDTRKARTAAGSQQNPNAGRAGATVGTVASILAPLPGAKLSPLRGVPLAAGERAARVLSGTLNGAAYGGFNGLTDGDADLTRGEVGEAAKETANRAAGGALFGAAAAGAAEAARPLWPWLHRSAVEQGRKVLQGNSDIAAATRRPLSDEAVEEVLAAGGIKPFSTTQATHQRVEQLSDEASRVYNQLLVELEKRGVKGAEVRPLADQLLARYQQEFASTGADKATANVFSKESRNLEQLARGGTPGAQGPEVRQLGLQQAEGVKRSLQKGARYDRLQLKPTDEAKQEAARMVKEANEAAVEAAGQQAGRGSEVAQLAERFQPLKSRTGRLLEAQVATERAASKAAQRGSLGLKDYLIGSAAGDPVTALATSAVSGLARNRFPSAAAAGTYGLSEGLRTGSLSPELAKAITLVLDPTITDSTQALIEALRRRREKP